MSADIQVFTTPTCPYCEKVKNWLEENDYDYTEWNVADNKDKAREMIEKTGQRGVPQTFIGNKAIIGFRPEKIEEIIEEQEAEA
jgi:glutaredoxin-like YruB-family protein